MNNKFSDYIYFFSSKYCIGTYLMVNESVVT